MQGHDVGPAQQVVQILPEIRRLLRAGIGIGHLRAEGDKQPGHGVADTSQAHDAHFFALQQIAHALFPDARADVAVHAAHVAQQIQGVAERQFGHGQGRTVGRVAHGYAPLFRSRAIHAVHAHAAAGNNPELRQRLHDPTGQRLRPGGHTHAAPQYFDGLVFRQGPSLVVEHVLDSPLAQQIQRFPAELGET